MGCLAATIHVAASDVVIGEAEGSAPVVGERYGIACCRSRPNTGAEVASGADLELGDRRRIHVGRGAASTVAIRRRRLWGWGAPKKSLHSRRKVGTSETSLSKLPNNAGEIWQERGPSPLHALQESVEGEVDPSKDRQKQLRICSGLPVEYQCS